MEHDDEKTMMAETSNLIPVLPLRDVVVYPHMVIPLFVGREKSIRALDTAMAQDKRILLVAQKSADVDDPQVEDIHRIGTLSSILQLLKLPDGTVKVLVEGAERASIKSFHETDEFFSAEIETLESGGGAEDREVEVLMRSLLALFDQYVKLNKKVPPEILTSLSGIDDAGRLADTIAAHMALKIEEKQHILEIDSVRGRLEHLMGLIEGEIDILQIEKRIRGRVKQQMEKSQREYYLNEQMKAIQKELGELEDAPNEVEELQRKIDKAGMTKEARDKAQTELNKLKMMSPMSAEATVVRNYIDWLVSVPWKKKTKIRHDLALAEQVLEEDHYGLDKVKERIIEYLAVRKLSRRIKGPILCFVGPPGVGKTSLGKSIARALGREFLRISLGGVRDEAEIRGHRRTYVGALPGRIIQGLRRAGSNNPVFMMDEVDKIGADYRGDPSSALLEVLDPEQNNTFRDHYLAVPFDLSRVMFITTANLLDPIQPAFRDRMEIIQLPGYTEEEKMEIAARHLVPKQIKENALSDKYIQVTPGAIRTIISRYTREAGVRNLEREIASICRKVARKVAENKKTLNKITSQSVESYLGPPKIFKDELRKSDRVGVATGVAWTETGGEVLFVEALKMKGKGGLMLTGLLGDVMKESAQAALSYARVHTKELKIDNRIFGTNDFHVHIPEGAIPKDGPSAGITIAAALISLCTNRAVRWDTAMSGEITLQGNVLPVGGVKEKVLAAQRAGVKRMILPSPNRKDLIDIPKVVKKEMEFIFVEDIRQVLEAALVRKTGRPT